MFIVLLRVKSRTLGSDCRGDGRDIRISKIDQKFLPTADCRRNSPFFAGEIALTAPLTGL
jgi:hypothetical protein